MTSTILRIAVAAATLFATATCFSQAGASRSAEPGTGGAGVFRPTPARSDDAGAPRAATGQPMPILGLDREYRIGANDLLEIEVLNVDKEKRAVRVNAAGQITLPLIGTVVVAGLTQPQVERHIAGLYGEKYLQDPQVSVFIKEFTTERITVDGAVSKPGIYPIVGQMTLLRALALAGGFGQIANSSQVMLFRQDKEGKRQVATFDVDKIRAGKEEDPPIRGDDLIVVQRDSTRAVFKDSVFRDILDSINPLSILR
jgi:polysaccharide export outer membrane protein